MNSSLIYQVKKSQETLLDLLHIRNFTHIKKNHFIQVSSILETKLLENELSYIFKKNSKKIYINYLYNISIKVVNELISEFYDGDTQIILIVIGNKFTSIYNDIMYKYMGSVTIFKIQELLFNVMKNIYVPKHSIYEGNINKLKVTDQTLLPKIKLIDPPIKFIGGKINDIIEIERNIKLINKKYYRLVI